MNVIALSKVIPLFLYPLSIAIGFGLIALLFLLLRKPAIAGLMVLLLVTTLGVAGNPRVANYLVANIERTHLPLTPENTPQTDAIVMLAGVVGLPAPPRVSADLSGSADRILHTARLYRAAKAPMIIVAGGNVFPQPGVKPESFYVAQLLQEWGVPKQAIITEGKSQNTYQNAVESKQILDQRDIGKILLVTSALHMPRALAVFRSLGIDAIPAVTDITIARYDLPDTHPTVLDWLPNVQSLSLTTLAIREHLGTWAYRWLGWIHDSAQ
jgi:uncharacterized SAM-binding protein YcdF (DUF218 family)